MRRPISRLLALLFGLGLASSAGAANASLRMTFTNGGEPLPDPMLARFYVFEPEEREQYLAWGHGNKVARLPAGTYDVVIKYRNDQIYEERLLEGVELSGNVEQQIDFEIPVARLTVRITAGGEPIPEHVGRYSLYEASRRGKPLVSRRPGETVTIRPGIYDIEVAYRDRRGLQASWIEFFSLDGEQEEVVDFGRAAVLFGLTFVEHGRQLPADRGRWRVFESGRRDSPLAEGGSGERVDLPVGTYDIGLLYRRGRKNVERWLEGVPVHESEQREVEISVPVAKLRVDVRHRGALLSDAWFRVHPTGDPGTVVATGMSGTTLDVEQGVYDIGCFHRNRGIRVERWIRAQNVLDRVEHNVELEFRTASLRVLPTRRARRKPNLLLLVDSSTGMASELGRETKLDVMRSGVKAATASLGGDEARLGIRAYGTSSESMNDCRDSALLLPLGDLVQRRLADTLDRLQPGGLAPISYSLDLGATDMPADGNNTLLLLAGGTESCGRDPCSMASRLLRRGNVDRIYVVGLGIPPGRRHELACIGEFHMVSGREQLRTTLHQIFREIADNDSGTVSVFQPDGGEWVVSGALGERLEVAEDTYDLLIHAAGRTYSWPSVAIQGDFEAAAGPRP